MNYEALFVDPTGRTSREQYAGGLITLLAAVLVDRWIRPAAAPER